ncbi:MAG: hypothetical protein AAB833_02070 [Patescibacteria group bacterium]
MTARITSGQKDQIGGFSTAATRKVVDALDLDKDQAQLVIENGGEFSQMVGDAVRSAVMRLSVSQEYANEEIASTWVYPPEYTGPAPIGEQIDRLVALFGLSLGATAKFVERLPTLTLPEGAEGWFAIPSVEALAARFFPGIKDPAMRYCRAVELILGKIKESRSFYNYREGQITPDRLRQHARTAMMLEQIAAEQKGDILVIPAQFGLRHRGKSVRRSRATFRKDEFGHGALSVGSMLLTHPTRLARWEQLHIDCAGDEFAPETGGVFSSAPVFRFSDGGVGFGTYPVDSAVDQYGTSSGFLPQ